MYVQIDVLLIGLQSEWDEAKNESNIRRDLITMKGGLKNAPAFAVQWLLAGQKPIADQFAYQRRSRLPHKVMLPRDKQLLHWIGIVDQVNPFVQNAKRRDRPEALRCAFEKLEHSARRAGPEKAQDFPSTWPRRMSHMPIVAFWKQDSGSDRCSISLLPKRSATSCAM